MPAQDGPKMEVCRIRSVTTSTLNQRDCPRPVSSVSNAGHGRGDSPPEIEGHTPAVICRHRVPLTYELSPQAESA